MPKKYLWLGGTIAIIVCASIAHGQPADPSPAEDKALVERKIAEVSQAGTGYVEKKKKPEAKEIEVNTSVVKSDVAAARAALSKAESAKEPSAAAKYMGDAMSRANDAQGYARRIENDAAHAERVTTPAGAGPTARQRATFGDSPTLRTLIRMDAGGEQAQKQGFEGTGTHQAEFKSQGTGTQFFSGSQDIRGYNSQRGEITTSDGHTVNVKPLIDALQKVSPNAANRPFVSVETSAGGAPSLRLSPAAQQAISQDGAALRNIGGVALDVTFQRLALVGVPEFRVAGRVSLIANPVLISLRRLLTAAQRYSSSSQLWSTLPDEIRYPGGIGRVNGYVVDPKSEDVFILGTVASRPESRIDIDVFSVLLNAVWAKGLTPTVSLDPLPNEPGGPQYPRIANVPRDALVTRTMLDADYAMKRINLGAEPIEDPAFESLAALYAKTPPKDAFAARFWLRPIPLNVSAVRVSQSGRAVLFDAGVQALTESVRIDADGIAGTGSADPVHSRAVELFTRAYSRLESSQAVRPQGVFALLHGIVDVVTMCKLLRESGIDYPVLNEARQLPYRQLTGDRAVPSYYTGLHVRYGRSAAGGDLFLSGGVELRSRPTRPSLDQFDDYVGRTLEQTVDAYRADGFVKPLDLTFTLPVPQPPTNSDAEVAKQAGFRDLMAERIASAAVHLREATVKDPADIDAWIYLGWAEAQIGHGAQADEAISHAEALGADDFATRLISLDIALFANPALNLDGASQTLRWELGSGYTHKLYAALYRGDRALAVRSADRALRFWPYNAEAFLGRAQAELTDNPAASRRDSANAVNLFRQAAQHDSGYGARPRLAFALALNVAQQLDDLPHRLNEQVADDQIPDLLSDMLKQSRQAVQQAHEAVTLDPTLGLALATELRARGLELFVIQIANLFTHASLKIDPAPAQQLADLALSKFPNFPPIRRERAVLLQLLGDARSAEREINEAISLDPTSGKNFLMRATFRAEQKNCSAANQDLRQALTLKQPLDDYTRQVFSLSDCQLAGPR